MVNTEAEEIAAVIQHLQGGVVIFLLLLAPHQGRGGLD